MAGCQKQNNIELYDVNKAYIEFGTPVVWGKEQQLYMDSAFFSFAAQSVEEDKAVFAIPVHIIGQRRDQDRAYSVKINAPQTSIDVQSLELSKPVIRAGKFIDTLYVTVTKYAAMKESVFTLALDLEENPFFDKGKSTQTSYRVEITDQLVEPTWWSTWRFYFGPYRREVYQQWIRTYLPGLDPSPVLFEGDKPNFSWSNMPQYADIRYFPVTFMYIDKLRKYFEDNEVYPGGDRTRPRIFLP